MAATTLAARCLVVIPNKPIRSGFAQLLGHKQAATTRARYGVPAIYFTATYFAKSGGLICYGTDFAEQFRQAAGYVDRILKGEKPANLPIQQPTKFELVINLKAAKALGLIVPSSLLATADEVIE